MYMLEEQEGTGRTAYSVELFCHSHFYLYSTNMLVAAAHMYRLFEVILIMDSYFHFLIVSWRWIGGVAAMVDALPTARYIMTIIL